MDFRFVFVYFYRREPSETASGAHHVHAHAAGHPGVSVRQNAVSGHFHEGGGGAEDQPARVQSAGQFNLIL